MGDGFEPMQIDDFAEENENDLNILAVNGVNNVRGDALGVDSSPSYNVMNPTIDLETYIQGFSGLAKVYRLRFIAQHCPPLRLEALKSAVSHLMTTHNTVMLLEMHRKLTTVMADQDPSSVQAVNLPDVAAPGSGNGDLLSPSACREWIESKNKRAAMKLEKLDTDLKNYKSNSIKESIRRGYDDLAEHYLDCGELQSALKCFTRARDYCTSGKHLVQSCLNIVRVSIYSQNWSQVVPTAMKGISAVNMNDCMLKAGELSSFTTSLYCAKGLAEIAQRKYKSAATGLLNAQLDYCTNAEFLSPQNVAIYGGLCALATFDRDQIRQEVLGSQTFKLFLELDPQLREVIHCFYESKYDKCLSILADMRENLYLDIYLAPHVDRLYSLIRNKSIVQYFSPYLSADLHLMAKSLNTTVNDLEDELITLILDEKIQGRIDSHNKVLYRQGVEIRAQTFEKAIEVATAYKRRLRMMILRSAILKSNVVVKPKRTPEPGC